MAGKNLKSMSVNDIYISKLETEVIRQKQKIDNLTTELYNWRNAAEKYSHAFYNDLIPMSISRINDGVIIEINNAITETLGFCREDVINKSVFDLQIWVEPRERLELIEETAEKRYVKDKDFLIRKKNGEIIQGHITSSLINIDDNRCMIIALQDVTTNARLRKALQLANEMFSKAFYDNLTMMAITRLEDGVYIDVNSVFADKFGWTREEIIGKSSVELGIWEANERKDMYEQLCVNGCINDWKRK